MVNGTPSEKIEIKRGCRQGDPISPYLFILCAEILACKIREDDTIKGNKIGNVESKITQFADDTSALLEGDRRSFENLFKHLDDFAVKSGLKLNIDKTTNVWLGSKKNSNVKYLPQHNMTWNPDKFKLLGIWFTNKIESMTELNMKDKFNEIKKLFNIWIKRSSTPIGRVVILKSLILSKLIYLWIMLPNPPDKFIRELQEKCFEFIWDGKRDKIKRSIATLHTKEGGINIPDIKTYIDALKITWINRLIKDPPAKWKHILENKHENIRLINSVGAKCFKDNIVSVLSARFWESSQNLKKLNALCHLVKKGMKNQ